MTDLKKIRNYLFFFVITWTLLFFFFIELLARVRMDEFIYLFVSKRFYYALASGIFMGVIFYLLAVRAKRKQERERR